MMEILQFLCGAAFYILYALKREFVIVPAFMLPLFVGLHVFYIRGIRSLKEDRIKTTRYTVMRWLLLAFYVVSLIFGVTMK